jgi:hypothetical protein
MRCWNWRGSRHLGNEMLVDIEESVQRTAGRRELVCVNAAPATCDCGHIVSSTFEHRVHVVAIATSRLRLWFYVLLPVCQFAANWHDGLWHDDVSKFYCRTSVSKQVFFNDIHLSSFCTVFCFKMCCCCSLMATARGVAAFVTCDPRVNNFRRTADKFPTKLRRTAACLGYRR